ncbi:MAG TPA: exodeoxyribonuclease I, partial [Rheinheimera sp.]|nr:exodeoxyribonuclease I [Rheinheimera sp.]
ISTLISKLYTKSSELADGEQRLGLKLIHLNKCPVLAPAKTLTEERATELGINRELCLQHLEWLRQHRECQHKVIELYQQQDNYSAESNPDYQLYSGFISNSETYQAATAETVRLPV